MSSSSCGPCCPRRGEVLRHGLKKVVPGPDPEGSWQGTAPEGADDYLQAVGTEACTLDVPECRAEARLLGLAAEDRKPSTHA